MVVVERTPDGEPFAVVIDPDAQAQTSVASDGSSVTVVLRKAGKMPCSVIFPGDVAAQAFGASFAAALSAAGEDTDAGDTDPGEPHSFTGGGV